MSEQSTMAEWAAAIEKEMERPDVKTRREAVGNVVKKNPDLHRRLLIWSNKHRPRALNGISHMPRS